jgi:hypothetical protein
MLSIDGPLSPDIGRFAGLLKASGDDPFGRLIES